MSGDDLGYDPVDSGFSGNQLEGIGLMAQGIGGVFSSLASFEQGAAARDAAKFKAKMMRRNARERMAQSNREYKDIKEKGALVKSRAQAVMAAQGQSDAKVLSDIQEKVDYNAMAALYEGISESSAMKRGAIQTKGAGSQARHTANSLGYSRLIPAAAQLGIGYKKLDS